VDPGFETRVVLVKKFQSKIQYNLIVLPSSTTGVEPSHTIGVGVEPVPLPSSMTGTGIDGEEEAIFFAFAS
jgi:hypothetical protein